MLKLLQDIITDPLFGIIWGLVGFFIGNKLAIDRDRRREFNDLINPIRHELLGVKNHPSSNLTGTWGITLSLICEKLPFWKRKAFDNAIENYKKSKSSENININVDGMGGWSYKDTEWIVHAANPTTIHSMPPLAQPVSVFGERGRPGDSSSVSMRQGQ